MEHLPQIIYLVLTAVSLLLAANQHGKPRSNQNFWTSLVAFAIVLSILWWGGFFSNFLP